ncbi:hypothetical protein NECAME_00635 [Necator americanus]|uniref:Uncharacterized protein n=1 Tax=Necator americanus TaxID=51031 RepID=W2T0Y6_NECAM|nr:hypothetical protein NECAME_00635 [Necator americanus]ETN75224.1 hypothetical protein NECAME_00635 [Necator americanus]
MDLIMIRMITVIQLLILIIFTGNATASSGFSSFGRRSRGDNYGFDSSRDHYGFDSSANSAYGNKRDWNYANHGSSSAFDSGRSASEGAHNSGSNHQDFAHKFDNKMGDFGVRTKSFGFFDYKYIRPQYHLEQFHSEERHGNKYATDAHSSGGHNSEHGGYHSRGHDGYGSIINCTQMSIIPMAVTDHPMNPAKNNTDPNIRTTIGVTIMRELQDMIMDIMETVEAMVQGVYHLITVNITVVLDIMDKRIAIIAYITENLLKISLLY